MNGGLVCEMGHQRQGVVGAGGGGCAESPWLHAPSSYVMSTYVFPFSISYPCDQNNHYMILQQV